MKGWCWIVDIFASKLRNLTMLVRRCHLVMLPVLIGREAVTSGIKAAIVIITLLISTQNLLRI